MFGCSLESASPPRGKLKCALKLHRDLPDLYPPSVVTSCHWSVGASPSTHQAQETSCEASNQGRESCEGGSCEPQFTRTAFALLSVSLLQPIRDSRTNSHGNLLSRDCTLHCYRREPGNRNFPSFLLRRIGFHRESNSSKKKRTRACVHTHQGPSARSWQTFFPAR